jgi:hypothetical protein
MEITIFEWTIGLWFNRERKYRMLGYSSTYYDCVNYRAFGFWFFTFAWHKY